MLLRRLETLGIRDKQLELFRSYLHNRTQCVRIGDYISTELSIKFGVPLGSIIGRPTLTNYVAWTSEQNDLFC